MASVVRIHVLTFLLALELPNPAVEQVHFPMPLSASSDV